LSDKLLELFEPFVTDAPWELVSFIKFNHLRVRLWLKELVDLKVLKVCVLCPVQVHGWKIKLRDSLLIIDLVLVVNLHICENRAGDSHEELGHFENLAMTTMNFEALPV